MQQTYNTLSIMTRIIRRGVLVSLKKFHIGPQLIYGGLALDADPDDGVKIRPDPDRLSDLLSLHSPKDKKEIQSLLSLINSIKVLSLEFSTKTTVMRNLAKAKTQFV